ncbi:hypothetical protein MNB_SV-5-1661 [hydrothermal vent metagenome]|uniref:Uncharacterized protein n=1 Tax=hydrothermal vent metagenome TaxID=652676 RepID=A0A1W1ED96_9ZZZZ
MNFNNGLNSILFKTTKRVRNNTKTNNIKNGYMSSIKTPRVISDYFIIMKMKY